MPSPPLQPGAPQPNRPASDWPHSPKNWQKARLNAAAALATAAASTAAHRQRVTLVADVATRTAALADAQEKLSAAEKEETAAREPSVRPPRSRLLSRPPARWRSSLRRRRRRAEILCRTAGGRRLADQLAQIERILTQRAEVTEQLAAIALTAELFGEIDESAALVELLDAQLRADAGAVEFTAPVTWRS